MNLKLITHLPLSSEKFLLNSKPVGAKLPFFSLDKNFPRFHHCSNGSFPKGPSPLSPVVEVVPPSHVGMDVQTQAVVLSSLFKGIFM